MGVFFLGEDGIFLEGGGSSGIISRHGEVLMGTRKEREERGNQKGKRKEEKKERK